jgi:UDP-GlcNAc:undecaprenyl-phosphate GlcNAc-1-phosphate transferase
MPYLVIFCAALVAALILTPLVKRLALRFGIMSAPGGRRKHAGPIPMLGGLAVFGGWVIGVILIYWLLPPLEQGDELRLRGVVIGSLVMVVGGLLDDWRELKPWVQFLIQFIGATIAMGHLIFIEVFTSPVGAASFWTSTPFSWLFTLDGDLVWIWRPIALLITVFWVVGMINAINWLDGLDGLAAGVCTIAALLFAWHSYRLGQTTVSLSRWRWRELYSVSSRLILRRHVSSSAQQAHTSWATRLRHFQFYHQPNFQLHCSYWLFRS